MTKWFIQCFPTHKTFSEVHVTRILQYLAFKMPPYQTTEPSIVLVILYTPFITVEIR
jgi:hypothetical protein